MKKLSLRESINRVQDKKMRMKTIAMILLVLTMVSLLIFNLPMAHMSSGDPIIVVTPSGDTTGVSDADSIQWALENIAPGGMVSFSEGHFYVSRPILVEGFSGSLKGAGKEKTIIEAVRKSETEGFALIPHPLKPNERSKLLWFNNPTDHLSLEDLTFQVLDPQPSEPYDTWWGGIGCTALTSFVHIMGGDCEVEVKNVKMTGAESDADGNYHGMNMVYPCQRHPGTGDLTIEDCVFEDIGGVVIDLMDLSGCTVKVSHVETYNTQGIFLWQSQGIGLEPSTFIFTQNNLRLFSEHNFAGIDIRNPSGFDGTQHNILISHNKFYSPSWNEPYAAIFSWLVSGAVVTNNIFTGAGECAIYVNPFGGYFGDWRLIGNNFQNFDATLAPIFLGSGTTNCLVVGGPRDTVIDNGVDNIIVGANNMGYHELGQDIKDAMQQKKEMQEKLR